MPDIIETIKLLGETPMPNILTISGILFLFVAIGVRFTSKGEENVNTGCASALGVLLLISGIFMYVIPTVTPKSKSISDSRLDVYAEIMKNPTGIFVEEGDVIHFEYLSGQWTGNKSKPGLTNGCGFTWDDPNENSTWLFPPEQRGSSLVGYIDSEPFWIGCEPINIIAPTSGEIFLGMSDCLGCFDNNEGKLEVKVTLNQ